MLKLIRLNLYKKCNPNMSTIILFGDFQSEGHIKITNISHLLATLRTFLCGILFLFSYSLHYGIP